MARISVDGLELDYELIGPADGRPLVITPGGRYPRDTAGVPELGEIFAAKGYRVLLWDRPGCGASDIAFTAPSESVMNCEALVGLAGVAGQIGMTMAFAKGHASRIAVIALSQILFGVAFDMAFWNRTVNPVSWLGMLLVIGPTAWLILSKPPQQSHDLIEVEMED